MRFTTVALLAGSAAASAIPRAPAITDNDILNYALTLEFLEDAFYSGALAKFQESDFSNANEHALFQQIAGHEATHVQVLQSVLGNAATSACNYSFPYTDVQSFKALAMVLEGVGVTAYLGAAQFLTSKELLTAAGSILTTEARHASWLATVNGADPWSGAFDAPLQFDQVFSLASPFILNCPSSNPPLPVKAFPAITVAGNSTNLSAGQSITFQVPSNVTGSGLFAAFLTGTSVDYVPYTVNQSVTIPSSLNATGTIYAVITNANSSATDDTTVAGPAILMFNSQLGTNGSGSTGGSSGGNGGSSGSSGSSGSTASGSGGNSPNAGTRPAVTGLWALAVVLAAMIML